jgi:hypothetical protein
MAICQYLIVIRSAANQRRATARRKAVPGPQTYLLQNPLNATYFTGWRKIKHGLEKLLVPQVAPGAVLAESQVNSVAGLHVLPSQEVSNFSAEYVDP